MIDVSKRNFRIEFESQQIIVVGDVEVRHYCIKDETKHDTVGDQYWLQTRCITEASVCEQWHKFGPIPTEVFYNPELLRICVQAACLASVHLSHGSIRGRDPVMYSDYWADMYAPMIPLCRTMLMWIVDDVIFVHDPNHDMLLTTSVFSPSFSLCIPLKISAAMNTVKGLLKTCREFVKENYKPVVKDSLTPADVKHLTQILKDQGWAVYHGVHYAIASYAVDERVVLQHRDMYGTSLHRNSCNTLKNGFDLTTQCLILGLREGRIHDLLSGRRQTGKWRYIRFEVQGSTYIYSTDLLNIECDVLPAVNQTFAKIEDVVRKTWNDDSRANKRMGYFPRRTELNGKEEEPMVAPSEQISTSPLFNSDKKPQEVGITLQIDGVDVLVTFSSKSPQTTFKAAQAYLRSHAPLEPGDNPHSI